MKKNNSNQGERKKIEINENRCLRCKHQWFPRSEKKPIQCPKCHSPYWDKPYRNPSNKQREKN